MVEVVIAAGAVDWVETAKRLGPVADEELVKRKRTDEAMVLYDATVILVDWVYNPLDSMRELAEGVALTEETEDRWIY